MGTHGDGTIVPVKVTLKDGTVLTRHRIAVTMADGRRVWRRAKTPREAERKRRELVEARELDLDPTRQTLAVYLRSWIERQRKGQRIRLRTLIGYERIVESIIDEIGTVPLSRLSRRKVQAWVDDLDGSPQTVRNYHAVLRKALAGATGDLIPLNPAIGVELPKRVEFHGSPLTTEEARRLLRITRDTRLALLWRLALVTGLREGELLGLPRDAVSGSILTVTSQLQRINGAWRLGPPKAARSLTRIALDAETLEMVRAHLARMAAERDPSWRYFGLMFLTEAGEPYHAATILREFRAACETAGISPRRVHDLRHTANRLMKDLNIDREVRKARHGHSTDEMSNHYGGASEVLDQEAVDRLAKAIS